MPKVGSKVKVSHRKEIGIVKAYKQLPNKKYELTINYPSLGFSEIVNTQFVEVRVLPKTTKAYANKKKDEKTRAGLIKRTIAGKLFYQATYAKTKEEAKKIGENYKELMNRLESKNRVHSYRVVKLTSDEKIYLENHGYTKGLNYILFISTK